jgi:hypothetical protein
MTLDELVIILRSLILIVLAIISQLAFHRRQFKVMFWSLGFWLTIFRLLIIRVLKVYAHQDDPNVLQIEQNLMSGLPSLITDVVLILTTIPLYIWMKDTYKVWVKTTKKL